VVVDTQCFGSCLVRECLTAWMNHFSVMMCDVWPTKWGSCMYMMLMMYCCHTGRLQRGHKYCKAVCLYSCTAWFATVPSLYYCLSLELYIWMTDLNI
jgi:hypothetical protein